MGGTQDNGTWSNLGRLRQRDTFTQVIYGDGGNAGYDATNATGASTSSPAGSATRTSATATRRSGSSPRRRSSTAARRSAFYWPQIGDPNPVAGHAPDLLGRAARLADLGVRRRPRRARAAGHDAGHRRLRGELPGVRDLGRRSRLRRLPAARRAVLRRLAARAIPSCTNQPGDLTGTVYGADRAGGSISWLARDGADHGTLWAATSAGPHLRDAQRGRVGSGDGRRGTGSTARPSGGSPTRFPSGIYVDPADTGHAWISYSGLQRGDADDARATCSTSTRGRRAPGSGTFTNLNVESGTSAFPTPTRDGDLPVSDVVRDDANKTLYVATDFGVLRGDNDGTGGWHVTDGHAALRGHAPRDPAVLARRRRASAASSASRCCTRRRTRRASGR